MAKLSEAILGAKIGSLTICSEPIREHINSRLYVYVLAKCDCGKETKPLVCNLGTKTISCGCTRAARVRESVTTHGMSGTRTYKAWCDMLKRCFNAKNKRFEAYKNYAPEPRWKVFENFYQDMGECPSGMSLDRIRTNEAYSKENCRWATAEQQANNKVDTLRLVHEGETYSLAQICRKFDLVESKVYARLAVLGWSPENAIAEGVKWASSSQALSVAIRAESERERRKETKRGR